MAKVLVTGASGFIGSTLIEALNARGDQVFALMRRTSSPKNLQGLEYTKVEGSLADQESLNRAVRGMDVIYHLAGVTAAPSKAEFFEHNAYGTGRIAKAAAEHDPALKRFVYVSSIAAGGPSPDSEPRTEEQPANPVSLYGRSKHQGELEALKYADRIPITIIRPPIVYGPKDKGVFVLIQTVARNLMPMVQGGTAGGHKYYSVIHSQDLVKAILLAGQAQQLPSGEIFYVSSGQVHTYEEFLTAMAVQLHKSPWKIRVPPAGVRLVAAACSAIGFAIRKTLPMNLDKLNEVLPDYWICSSEKAKRLLGFRAEYDLTRGMSDAIEWYKRERWI